MHAFAESLETIPLALAENSGFNPIENVSEVKSRQITESNPRLGIDCLGKGTNGLSFTHLLFKQSSVLCLLVKCLVVFNSNSLKGSCRSLKFLKSAGI